MSALTAITDALASAHADGKLAVVGDAKLAAALATGGREVVPVGLPPRAAKRTPGALADTSSLADGTLAALIALDVTGDDDWARTLGEWSRVVRDGGAIVLVDRGRAAEAEASLRALCGGLSELEQRHAGRTVVTSGLVSHL